MPPPQQNPPPLPPLTISEFAGGAMDASIESQQPASATTYIPGLANSEGLALSANGHASDRYELSGLFAQSHRFLEKVKCQFGEHSRQSVTILDTLGEFRAGKLPKQDVCQTIVHELGERVDLVHEFEDISNHQDAFMGSSALEHLEAAPPTPTSAHVSPGFLQPQHHPHLPMPSMSALWSPTRCAQWPQHTHRTSINPDLLRLPMTDRDVLPLQQALQEPVGNGYGYHDLYQAKVAHNTYHGMLTGSAMPHLPSSPATRAPARFGGPNQYTSPALGQMRTPAFSPYAALDYGPQLSSPFRGTQAQPKRSYTMNDNWERDEVGNTWTNESEHDTALRHAAAPSWRSPTMLNEEPTPPLSSHYRSPSRTTPFLLGTPIAIPLGRPTLDMSLPNKHYQTEAQFFANTDEELYQEEETPTHRYIGPATLPMMSDQSSEKSSARRASVRGPRTQGQYVHSICGKTFTSRYAVKKHHWGNKCDDLDTVTGCWAKHKRPNVQWDEHPSCRDQQIPKARGVKNRQLEPSQAASPNFKAPVIPAMIPNPPQTLPGFPILNELPQTVAETLRRSPTPKRLAQFKELPYHTSRLPMLAGLDSLLTAVNVAIKIDAPKPQGRNDSVVSHLDAQAVAEEERRYQPTSLPRASQEYHDAPYTSQALPPLSQVGLGITQAPEDLHSASSEVIVGEHQAKLISPLESAPQTIVDTHSKQVTVKNETSLDLAATATTGGKRKRNTTTSISKMGLKMLGVKGPASPVKKKQRSVELGNGVQM